MSASIRGMELVVPAATVPLIGNVTISAIPRGYVAPPAVLFRRGGKLYEPGSETPWGEPQSKQLLYTNRNHIVKGGHGRVARLIAGLSSDFPDRVAVGDGGLQAGTSSPMIVPHGQTALEHEVSRELVSQRIVSEDGDMASLTFVALFKTAGSYQFAQPGQTRISEVGLFARDGVMLAAHNFAPIPVDVHRIGVLVEWEWVIL